MDGVSGNGTDTDVHDINQNLRFCVNINEHVTQREELEIPLDGNLHEMASDRTVAGCLLNGGTKLPVRRTSSKPGGLVHTPTAKFYINNGTTNGHSATNGYSYSPTTPKPANGNIFVGKDIVNRNEDALNKWKLKYEEAEDRRKKLLTENEKTKRKLQDIEMKAMNMRCKIEEIETELFEKNESLTKLTTASKSLFKEYDALKHQYDTETSAMTKALTDASHWYKENKILRRRTLLLDTDSVDEGVDACEPSSDASDLDNLKESVKSLSQEVAHLQAELNSAKLAEFETSEQNAQLAQELEEEKLRNDKLQSELQELTQSHEQIIRVSNIMKRELEDLKEMATSHKNNAEILRKEANGYKKERNVLAHQSTILMEGLDDVGNLLLVQEIEELKSTLEEERTNHQIELETLQEKYNEQEQNSHVEILEERLQLVEAELKHAQERANELEEKLKAPPIPPPPPMAPLLPPPGPPAVPLRIKKMSRTSPPPADITQANGQHATGGEVKKPANGVNEEIINQIKGGMFTLRKAKSEKKEREAPKAVSEMLNILGSLRRTSRNRISLSPASYGDVQL